MARSARLGLEGALISGLCSGFCKTPDDVGGFFFFAVLNSERYDVFLGEACLSASHALGASESSPSLGKVMEKSGLHATVCSEE